MNIKSDVQQQLNDSITVRCLEVEDVAPLKQVWVRVIGIDPGTRHFGLAYLTSRCKRVYEIELPRSKDALERMVLIQQILEGLRIRDRLWIDPHDHICIEGAGYSERFRQVELAEQRTATALYFLRFTQNIKLILPNVITKTVFGKATYRAKDVWTNLPPNGAAALAVALYRLDTLDK